MEGAMSLFVTFNPSALSALQKSSPASPASAARSQAPQAESSNSQAAEVAFDSSNLTSNLVAGAKQTELEARPGTKTGIQAGGASEEPKFELKKFEVPEIRSRLEVQLLSEARKNHSFYEIEVVRQPQLDIKA